MKLKIGRKVYDTEKSTLVGKNAQGNFGEPTGFEETMYKKGDNDFFLAVSGGLESQYPEEDLIPLETEDAKEWIARVLGEECVEEYLDKKFGKQTK